ncbi:MAG: glycosyltransferase family 2 protein [Candidatus Uhrbacteria bacterium]
MATLVLQLLTFKQAETLPPLFASLKNQTDKDWKLLVLDNGSSPEMREKQTSVIKKTEPDFPIEFFFSDKNLGFSGGHEFLYEKNNADYVMLVNDDIIFETDYIARLKKFLDENQKVGAVAGAILRWHFLEDGSVKKTEIVDSLGLGKNRAHKVFDLEAGKTFVPSSEPVEVFGVSGCLPMYRRSAVGDQLFDPTYINYKEDVDVAYRLKKTGWLAMMIPEARAFHKRSFQSFSSRKKISVELQFLSYRNHWRNLRKHLVFQDWLRNGWAIIPFEAIKFFYFLFTQPSIVWRTFLDFL